ncbi:MAG: SAM-dependent methyltransferase [Hyphomicrobiales bacterium]|nr:SAM-dependent methyltransferase [Hyphomicrobiales bacterium]
MSRATLAAVAVISAAVLAYQVLLMRLFSIVSWHHFAYMIISIALLGFGASGTALVLAQRWLVARFVPVFAVCAVLFAVTAIGSFAMALRLPFNPLAIVWDARQLAWLGFSYALLVLPFVFGGGAIGLTFSRYSAEIGRLYAFDLIGAGVGALGVVGLLFWLSPPGTLRLVAALGLLAAALACLGSAHRIAAAGLGLVAAVVTLWLPPALTALHPHVSQYKSLAMALQVPDARIIEERSSPLGLIDVVESPTIPFRHAPGLSLNNIMEPPPQLGIFTDAESISTITRFNGDLGPLSYLDFTTSALPYHLLDGPETLILGAGGGEQVLLALYHGAAEIDAVELNPQVIGLVSGAYADFAGDIYAHPAVDVHPGEARSFVSRAEKHYDLIQIPLLYSFGAAAAGTQSLHENYTYTVEAMRAYLDRLEPGGLLSVTLWVKLPPRDTLKLFATAVEALRQEGVADPGARLALIRSWKTSTLLVKNGPFTATEVALVREFTAERSFDLAWYSGMPSDEANRYNILERPDFFEAATALSAAQGEDYIDAYKFSIVPATDDRPYFYDFFKWRFLPELLNLRTQGAAAMLDMGYLILFATLVQAVILSLLLILAPLAIRRRRFGGTAPKARTSAYFLALGLAFLFIEIAYIQRFILFLGHPLYAVAVVVAGFLVFAGVGSALSSRLDRALHGARLGALEVSVLGISAVAVVYLFILAPLFDALIALPDPIKISIALALIAPLACFMGMPFPLGIAHVAREDADLVPWAWGINGCASVVAAILATLLAIHFGFTTVMLLAVALYLATPFMLRRRAMERFDADC